MSGSHLESAHIRLVEKAARFEIDRARECGGDMWEVAIWEDVLTVEGSELYYTYQVYNQVIVSPENVDAIRVLTGVERDGARSIEKTDHALGVLKEFLPGGRKVMA